MKHLVIGDIHSNFKTLLNIRKKYSPFKYKYIFTGDYCDYREDNPRENSSSIDVLSMVSYMVDVQDAVALLGNHDDKLLRYLKGNKVEIKEGFDNTIFDIERFEKFVDYNYREALKEFLSERPLFHTEVIDGKTYKFAHAIYPENDEIFHNKLSSTPKEWKALKDHAIWGYPRRWNEEDQKYERVFYWEEEKYHKRVPENTVKIAGHYHLIHKDKHFVILDATPDIATYVIEDDLIEIWKKD